MKNFYRNGAAYALEMTIKTANLMDALFNRFGSLYDPEDFQAAFSNYDIQVQYLESWQEICLVSMEGIFVAQDKKLLYDLLDTYAIRIILRDFSFSRISKSTLDPLVSQRSEFVYKLDERFFIEWNSANLMKSLVHSHLELNYAVGSDGFRFLSNERTAKFELLTSLRPCDSLLEIPYTYVYVIPSEAAKVLTISPFQLSGDRFQVAEGIWAIREEIVHSEDVYRNLEGYTVTSTDPVDPEKKDVEWQNHADDRRGRKKLLH